MGQDNSGETPLHKRILAPFETRTNIIRILINNKADISLENVEKRTPLDKANELLLYEEYINEYTGVSKDSMKKKQIRI